MKEAFDIAGLIDKHIRRELGTEEKAQLENWLNENKENQKLFDKITASKHQLSKLEVYQQFNKQRIWSNLEKEISEDSVIHFFSRKTLRLTASILFPLLIAGSITAYFFRSHNQVNSLADVDELIKPGTQKAVLILSDGAEVNLSNKVSRLEDKGTTIENKENKLQYISGEKSGKKRELVYNELRTPAGGTYNLKLADGTEVWLNAGSSLKFPVKFSDSIRKVYLTGEGYFDVTHTGSPFIVSLNDADVRVLGTSFNISAYPDEQEVVTTLVKGKVSFEVASSAATSKNSHILSPGQQAVMTTSESNVEIKAVNTSNYTSWKEGKLEFNNEDLELVMKKMSRWYNFKFSFENKAAENYHFTARFNREDSISDILNMLELTTNVKFKLEGNKIVIQ